MIPEQQGETMNGRLRLTASRREAGPGGVTD